MFSVFAASDMPLNPLNPPTPPSTRIPAMKAHVSRCSVMEITGSYRQTNRRSSILRMVIIAKKIVKVKSFSTCGLKIKVIRQLLTE